MLTITSARVFRSISSDLSYGLKNCARDEGVHCLRFDYGTPSTIRLSSVDDREYDEYLRFLLTTKAPDYK